MTPSPTRAAIIAIVQADAANDDDLEQLSTAVRTVAEIEAVADDALGHFVDQCRHTVIVIEGIKRRWA